VKLEKSALGKFGNPKFANTNKPSDGMKIRVMDIEIPSVNEMYYEKRVNKYGNEGTYRAEFGKQGEGVTKLCPKVFYSAMWVIDTDIVFNYGLDTDMKRAQGDLMDAVSKWHVYCPDMHNMTTTSLSELAIPIIDRIMMSWLKLQNAINMARPKGIQIEIGALEDIPLGANKKKFTPLQVIDLYEKKGILVYRKLDAQGRMSNYKPIEELENGLGKDAIMFYEIIDRDIQLLRSISGMNELTDASTPDSRTLTTVAQLAYEGTNNSLAQIVELDRFLLEELAKSTLIRIQDVIKDGGNIQGYIRLLGQNSMQFFKASPRLALHEMGIALHDKPTDEEKREVLEQMKMFEELQLLRPEDIFLIRNTQNVKQAQQILAYRVKKREQEKNQREADGQNRVIQGQQQTVVVSEKAKQQTMAIEYKLKTDYELALKKADFEREEMKKQYDLKMKELEVQRHLTENVIDNHTKQAVKNKELGIQEEPDVNPQALQEPDADDQSAL
jgi:hypothetical protein